MEILGGTGRDGIFLGKILGGTGRLFLFFEAGRGGCFFFPRRDGAVGFFSRSGTGRLYFFSEAGRGGCILFSRRDGTGWFVFSAPGPGGCIFCSRRDGRGFLAPGRGGQRLLFSAPGRYCLYACQAGGGVTFCEKCHDGA